MRRRRLSLAAVFLLAAATGCTTMRTFHAGMALMVGKGGSVALIDDTEHAHRVAAEYGSRVPQPRWQGAFAGDVADFIHFLDERRVLVGTMEMSRAWAAPSHGSLLLQDVADGSVIWEAERPSLGVGRYAVLAAEPVIALVGSTAERASLLVLDPDDGARLWERVLGVSHGLAVSEDAVRLAVAEAGTGGLTVRMLELDTGRELWRRELGSPEPAGGVTRIAVLDEPDALYVVAGGVARLSAALGEPDWQVEAEPDEATHAELHPEGALVWSERAVSLRERRSGEPIWSYQPGGGGIVLASAGEEMIVLLTVDANGADGRGVVTWRLEALDPRGGRRLWSHEAPGAPASPLSVADGLVVYTTSGAVVGVDGATGVVRFQTALSEYFRSRSPHYAPSSGMPDVLHRGDGRLHIARERAGVATIALPGGDLLWFRANQVDGAHSVPQVEWRQQVAIAMAADVKPGRAPKENGGPAAGPGGPPSRAMAQPRRDELIRAQRRYDVALREHHRALAENPGPRDRWAEDVVAGARDMRRLAAQSRVVHAEAAWTQAYVDHSLRRMEASFALAGAAMGAGVAAIEMIQATAVKAVARLMLLTHQRALELPYAAFQGPYYVWPWGDEEGTGLTLVELDTGRRTELMVGPLVTGFHVALPAFRVSTNGRDLVTLGVGLRSERFEEYVKWSARTVRPMLLVYDTDTLYWLDEPGPFDAQAESWEVYGWGALALENAALRGDIAGVEILLDAGVPVNVQFGEGFTALMTAAMIEHEMLIRALLARGADPRARNDHGRTAQDYANDRQIRRLLR